MKGAAGALAFVSGMAALSAVLRSVKAGQHAVAGEEICGGISHLLSQVTSMEYCCQ